MSKAKPSITQKMKELDELLTWFDSDDFELEKAVDTYKQAEELVRAIENDLMEVKNTISVVSERFDREKE